MASGEGLVAVLGWGLDDFALSARESSDTELLRCREILAHEDPGEEDWVKAKSVAGIRFIDNLLKERNLVDGVAT